MKNNKDPLSNLEQSKYIGMSVNTAVVAMPYFKHLTAWELWTNGIEQKYWYGPSHNETSTVGSLQSQ